MAETFDVLVTVVRETGGKRIKHNLKCVSLAFFKVSPLIRKLYSWWITLLPPLQWKEKIISYVVVLFTESILCSIFVMYLFIHFNRKLQCTVRLYFGCYSAICRGQMV